MGPLGDTGQAGRSASGASAPPSSGRAFRSRIARRVFLLFVLCSLLPLGGLAYFSQHYVTGALQRHAWSHLRQSARAGSSTLAERLSLLEAELRDLAEHAGGRPGLGDAKGSFHWAVRLAPDGPPTPIVGRPPAIRPLSPDEVAHLREGRPLLRTESDGNSRPRVLLFAPESSPSGGEAVLAGEVRPEPLWNAEDDVLFALDEAGRLLRIPEGVAPPPQSIRGAIAAGERIGRTSWSHDGHTVLGWTRTVFLKPQFHTVWTLVAAETEKSLFSGIREFRVILASVGLLTALVVVLLSLVQIRRTLYQVEVLRDAARNLAAQQLHTRVSIRTGDEFATLGDTFNHMADRLATHIRRIEAVNRVGVSLSVEQDSAGLFEAVLDGAVKATGADGGILHLASRGRLGMAILRLEPGDPGTPEGAPTHGDESVNRAADRAFRTASLVEITDLYAPEVDGVEGDRAFDRALGYRTGALLAVPMRDQDGEVLGVLQLMHRRGAEGGPGRFSPEDLAVAASLASQAGVTLGSHRRTLALQANEKRFRDLVEHSPAAICLHGIDGTLRYVNPAWAEWLGRGPRDFSGRSLADFLDRTGQERYEEYLEELNRDGVATGLARMATADGSTRVWAYRAVRCQAPDADPYVIGYAQDVTERRALERHVQQAQKMEAVGTLAGGIAHDFNNILNVIVGYADLAQIQIPEESRAHGYLDQVLTAGSRAQELVAQILAFSRHHENRRERIDLGPLVKEILKLIRATLPTTIEIRGAIDAGPTPVLADATQIHQVLMNLCTNASHAMDGVGGVLEVSLGTQDKADADEPPFHLPVGNYVRLTVKDTGCGMAPDVLARIFEPFFTTKPVGQGTGMGLAVAHGIVSSHGGTIAVESVPGRGTTFDVYLPRMLEEQDEDAQPSEHAAPPPRGDGERILFVDDEAPIVEVGEQILSALGYTPSVHQDPRQALEHFRAAPERFALAITDYTMPGMTGEVLIHELRTLRPDLPAILCTGHSHAIDAALAATLGIDAFCLKPVRMAELAREIRAVLDARRPSEATAPALADGQGK